MPSEIHCSHITSLPLPHASCEIPESSHRVGEHDFLGNQHYTPLQKSFVVTRMPKLLLHG